LQIKSENEKQTTNSKTNTMKKILLGAAVIAAMGIGSNAEAQLIDEANVTVSMDLQPILQLSMDGPSNIDFVFDDIPKYVGGIIKYGGTVLKVSSSVSWDLYAVGSSVQATMFWDQVAKYGAGSDPHAIDNIPLSALELHQSKANPFPGTATSFADYSATFGTAIITTGANNIYASTTPYTAPASGEKYIAGGAAADAAALVPGGSYLTNGGAGGNFYYSIDYRIKPGMPVIFVNAADNTGTDQDIVSINAAGDYAQPGAYTMNVKYMLMENN